MKSQKTIIIRFLACGLLEVCLIGQLHAEDKTTREPEWQSSLPMLQQVLPPQSDQTLPLMTSVREMVVRAFSNLEHAKEMAKIQSERVAPIAARRREVLVPESLTYQSDQENQVGKTLGTTVKNFIKKEGKIDIVPESLRSGLSFNFGKNHSRSTSSAPSAPRYRLIVTNIEPDRSSIRFASVDSNDYELVQYAGKANFQYAISPVYDESNLPLHRSSEDASPRPLWQSLSDMPWLHFQGKITPKGFGPDGKLTPAQIIKLEQATGIYTFEAETGSDLSPATAIHRFRVPTPVGETKYGEDRDKDLKKIKTSLENIYSFNGFVVNLEHYHQERRYQAGLLYRAAATQLELYTHIPEDAFDDDIWSRQRWELKLESSF